MSTSDPQPEPKPQPSVPPPPPPRRPNIEVGFGDDDDSGKIWPKKETVTVHLPPKPSAAPIIEWQTHALPQSGVQDFKTFRKLAIRYWERRRIIYNVLLVPPAFLGYALNTTVSEGVGDPTRLSNLAVVGLFILSAIGANICYAFVYGLEFLFWSAAPEAHWPRSGRTLAFVLGMLFAMLLALLGGRNISLMEYGFR